MFKKNISEEPEQHQYNIRLKGHKRWIYPGCLINLTSNIKKTQPQLYIQANEICDQFVVHTLNNKKKSLYAIINLKGTFYCLSAQRYTISENNYELQVLVTKAYEEEYPDEPKSKYIVADELKKACYVLHKNPENDYDAPMFHLTKCNDIMQGAISEPQFKKIFGHTKEEPGCFVLSPTELGHLIAWISLKTKKSITGSDLRKMVQ